MEKLLDTRDIAQLLGKSEWWVRTNRPPLRPPGKKVGGEWRFDPVEVGEWLRSLPSE